MSDIGDEIYSAINEIKAGHYNARVVIVLSKNGHARMLDWIGRSLSISSYWHDYTLWGHQVLFSDIDPDFIIASNVPPIESNND